MDIQMNTEQPKKGAYVKVDKVQKEIDKIKKLTCPCCNKLWRDSYKLKTHLLYRSYICNKKIPLI